MTVEETRLAKKQQMVALFFGLMSGLKHLEGLQGIGFVVVCIKK